MTQQIKSQNLEQTDEIAHDIGARLKGGEVIELVSDVGGGKTTFVRGLARSAGSKDHVSSPTFTISKLYKTPKFDIVHFDFYRLHEAGLIAHELADYLNDPKIVIVVEWADIVKNVLPEQRLTIIITSTGELSRTFTLNYPEQLAYLGATQ